jgi:hypothetical protein
VALERDFFKRTRRYIVEIMALSEPAGGVRRSGITEFEDLEDSRRCSLKTDFLPNNI